MSKRKSSALSRIGFEPMPFQTSIWNWCLRPTQPSWHTITVHTCKVKYQLLWELHSGPNSTCYFCEYQRTKNSYFIGKLLTRISLKDSSSPWSTMLTQLFIFCSLRWYSIQFIWVMPLSSKSFLFSHKLRWHWFTHFLSLLMWQFF